MKSRSQELLDKSIAAMISAIEIYNKPDFLYRGETFAILAVNGWELLLKAKYLSINNNNIRSLYIYDKRKNKDGSTSKKQILRKTKSGNPITHSIESIAKKLFGKGDLEANLLKNLEALIEFRDNSVHFYNYSTKFNLIIQEIGAATLKNYVILYKLWFGKDLSKYNFYLMPLSFVSIDKISDVLILNTEEKNFFNFVDLLENGASASSEFGIALNVDVSFSRSKAKDAIRVALSNDSNAVPVILSEEQMQEKYPYDYDKLTKICRDRYSDFKVNMDYHNIRRKFEEDRGFAYIRYHNPRKPKKNSRTIFYSLNILNQFDHHYTRKDIEHGS